MASGMWPAVSGAIAQQAAIDTVANNMANMNTQAFKKDEPTFKEYLATIEKMPEALDIPRGPIKDKDFYPLDGRDQSYVLNDGTYTDFKQGHLQVTDNRLDMAIEGQGFFEVYTPKGVQFTRNGAFQLSPEGRLVTSEGFPVLSAQAGGVAGGLTTAQSAVAVQPSQGGLSTQGGVAAELQTAPPPPEVVARFIDLRDIGPRISVGENGQIYAGENNLAQLSVVEFQDRNQLRKTHAGYYAANAGTLARDPAASTTLPSRIRQGMIETSNVNAAEEMAKMIKAQRTFEHNLKSIKVYDELMAKQVNEVGKL